MAQEDFNESMPEYDAVFPETGNEQWSGDQWAGDAWRQEYEGQWSTTALDAALEFAREIRSDPNIARNFHMSNLADPDFRPTWIHDPADVTVAKLVAAMNGAASRNTPPEELARMADRLAVMMTQNVWREIGQIQEAQHPYRDQVHEQLVDQMETAMQSIMQGITNAEETLVVRGLIEVVTYDRQARQFNANGTVPTSVLAALPPPTEGMAI